MLLKVNVLWPEMTIVLFDGSKFEPDITKPSSERGRSPDIPETLEIVGACCGGGFCGGVPDSRGGGGRLYDPANSESD